MNSSDLYSSLLGSLSALRNTMLSQQWAAAVADSTPAAQTKAFNASFAVQHAINILSNEALSDIADEMAAQADAISSATAEMTKSLRDIERVSSVLKSVSSLLSVIGKIVSLA